MHVSIAAVSMSAVSMACAVALSMAVATTASQADFLYLPPDETAPGSTEADGAEVAGPAHVRQPQRPGGAGAVLWHVRPGEMLRDVLSRWGGNAGVEVLFLTDRRYRLHEGRAFAGSFEDAAQALFAALSHLPHPPVGEAKAEGGALVVLHRASLHRASLHRASLHRASAHLQGDRQ